MTKSAETAYDLVVFGATSFVGQILTRYLLETCGVGQSVRWAIAGRSESKFNTLKGELGDKARDLFRWPVTP